MANVSKLLFNTVHSESFLLNIDPDDTALRLAKAKVRDRLRREFARAGRDHFGAVIVPRFFTQGSHAYRTLNDPAWTPPQQMDLDDGCYLPLSFMRGARPSQAASLFFEFVDDVLEELAEEEGWTFDPSKPTCVRVEIDDNAHIDIPLYAIPDAEFVQLQDRALAKANSLRKSVGDADNWEALPSDAVLLAHREEDWKISDPRIVRQWFLDAVELYDERFRRVCRYLKAWRDHHGPDLDRISSILLMACAWHVFEEIRRPFVPDRDDEALLRVAERLPTLLSGKVSIPCCKGEDLNRLTEAERRRAIGKAEELRDGLKWIVSACCDAQEAVNGLITLLGDRVPDRPGLVVVTDAKTQVMSHPKKIVAAPLVGRSQSG